MSRPKTEVKEACSLLMESLRTINEAHLANFSRKTVPEIELVKHVRKDLTDKLGSKNVFLTVKGLHKKQDRIVFLMQPDVDLSFRYKGRIHGVEFKLMRRQLRFYSGLEEALSYSTYGVDYSWIVHFFRRDFRNAKDYKRWMEFVIKKSECPSIGYIALDTKSRKVIIFPKEPFGSGDNKRLWKIVLKVKNRIFTTHSEVYSGRER